VAVPIKTETELVDLARRVLVEAGASPTNADTVARHLVLANLSGVDTHGVWHLPGYVDHLRTRWIDGTATPSLLQAHASSALVSGNWTFGQVAAEFAVSEAVALAEAHDMAIVGLVQCHHIGRLGHFTELAAARGFVAQVWAGGYAEEAPATMPYGGRARLLHTNPISMAFPAGAEPRVMFDFATTVVSGVKIENARDHGTRLPPGSIVDREGRPTDDPNAFFEGGGHASFGGHKGYAIAYAAEFLGRILTGSNAYADDSRAGPVLRNQGVTFIVFRPDLFASRAEYDARADELEQRTRAVPPGAGFSEVLVPGDPEWRSREQRRAAGIPIPDDVWQRLAALPRAEASG
jgi:LDH2 family malate/lactate/ureidoglycolate dehydrogenase